MGIAAATNLGHDLASGKYIAHMDQDDIALPHRLEQQMSFLEKFSDVDVLGGKMEMFGSTSGVARAPVADGKIKTALLFGLANIYNPTAMIRHSFSKEKNLKHNLAFKLPDWEFWVQAMLRGAYFSNLQEVILRYRCHKNQASSNPSRFRNEFIRVRLTVLELFYPELTPEERVTVEPLLQFIPQPNLRVAQVKASLGVINKMIDYKIQSRVKEDRQTLENALQMRKHDIQRALEPYCQQQ
jgi:glycosyltransferase involved in cell wall biosynthesis